MFFRAAPISTPIISVLVYSRKRGFINSLCTSFAVSSFSEAIRQAEGRFRATSSAWLGPESTQTSHSGTHSRMTSESRSRLPSSSPFATFTKICSFLKYGAKSFAVWRTARDGTANMTISAAATASARSVVAPISAGIFTPGRYLSFVRRSTSSSTASCRLDQIVTSCPCSASITANAVPQLPEPITVTFFISL